MRAKHMTLCGYFCSNLRDRIRPWLRDYDRLQSFAVVLIYIQIGCALVGSLGASYNGVLLINLAIALFALVAIESSSQGLGRTYAFLLFCAILLDVSWFILFSHEIWYVSAEDHTSYFVFSVKLTLVMQIVGFVVRLSSSLLWIQIYRLGASYLDAASRTDSDLRNSFLSPTIPSAFSLKKPLLQSPPTLHFKQNRFSVSCSYAEAGVSDDSRSATIDVVADIKTERIVVIGGSGFVGSAICKAAVSKGIEVISLSRSGRPTNPGAWVDQVTWISGDVFYVNWDEVLVGATAVVSTLGGFGSEEQMRRINGEANVVAVNAAKEFGIPKFILISVHDYNLPSFLLSSSYFTGKRKAESEVLSKYPNSGIVLRPAFIYGKRRVDGFEIPLDLIGEPAEKILRATANFTKPLSALPASDLLLAPPISVDDLALAVINGVTDDDFFGIFTIDQIKEAAEKVRA